MKTIKRIAIFLSMLLTVTVLSGCVPLDERVTAVPEPVQTVETPSIEPTEEPTVKPTISATEEVEEPEPSERRGSQARPKDSDEWTDEQWDQYTDEAIKFEEDYIWAFNFMFGYEPDEEIVDVATFFVQDVCYMFDDGAMYDEIIEGIIESEGSEDSQQALVLAIAPGVDAFCPWNRDLILG